MQYHGADYAEDAWDIFWFEKNIFGDVVAVYNQAGTKLVSYKYDAFGKYTATYHNGATTGSLVANNPFRYRGYYYDIDLELYYLNSRYYDAYTGRFISADKSDVITATPNALTDKNLFAYCDNNPIMRRDDGGEFWNYVIGGVVGAVVGGVVAAVNGEDTFGIIIGAAAGALSGVVAASGLSLIQQASITAGISAVSDFSNQVVDIAYSGGNIGSDYNVGQTLNEAVLGFATSVVGSVLGNFVDAKITKNLAKSNKLLSKSYSKIHTASVRQSTGRSSSALYRQANKFLEKSKIYLNTYRGISSVVGSSVSLWNVVR